MASLFKKEGSHTESVRTQTWSGCSEKGGARDGPVGYREQLLASILPSKDPYSGLGYSRSHTALDQPVPKLNPLGDGLADSGKVGRRGSMVDKESPPPASDEQAAKKGDRVYERQLYLYRKNLPISTRLRRAFKHPIVRVVVPLSSLLLKFKLVAMDPLGHSGVDTYLPIFGEAVRMMLLDYPADGVDAFVKFVLWLVCAVAGGVVGVMLVHHKLFRDTLGLRMFDRGQGSWFVGAMCAVLGVYGSSYFYKHHVLDLPAGEAMPDLAYLPLSERDYRKLHAAVSLVGGSAVCAQVFDIVMQDVSQYPHFLRKWRNWWREAGGGHFRIAFFWFVLALTTAAVLVVAWTDVLWFDDGGFDHNPVGLAEGGANRDRVLYSGFAVLADVLVLLQDWEFPTMDTGDLFIIPGLPVNAISVPRARLYVNGKWAVYGTALAVVTLADLRMLTAQLLYAPYLYAQYAGPGERIWTVRDPLVVAAVNRDPEAARPWLTWAWRGAAGGRPGAAGDVELAARDTLGARGRGKRAMKLVPYALPALLAVVFFLALVWVYRDNTASIKKRLQARAVGRRWIRCVRERRRAREESEETARRKRKGEQMQSDIHRTVYWQMHHGGGGTKKGAPAPSGGGTGSGGGEGRNVSHTEEWGRGRVGGNAVHPVYASAVPLYMYDDVEGGYQS